MDLLSLTVRALDLSDPTLSQGSFLNLAHESIVEKEKSKELRTINMDEVASHDTSDDCWVVIYDFVYDCTDFLRNHPGGSDVILEYAGRDATLAFIGTGHSRAARRSLERYLIGELPPEERIFRVPDGVKVAFF